MEDKKRDPQEGRLEGVSCAGARIEGKEYENPSSILYNEETTLSSPKNHFLLGMGLAEKKCVRCGKTYIPTRPEYAWEDCCSYTCYLHRNNGAERKNPARPCTAYDQYSGKKYRTFKSAEEAAEYMGLKKAGTIRDCCNGKTRTSCGFLWKWENQQQ